MKKITVFVLALALLLSVFALSVFSEQTISDISADKPEFTSYGDVTGDSKINLADASVILKYIAKWETVLNTEAADVTADGKVNLADVSRLLKYIAKWDVMLGRRPDGISDTEFKFLHYGDTAVDFHDDYIWSDDRNGGIISDAVIERNQVVEDKFDIKITAEECDPMGEAVTRMQAGQCDFEVIYEWGIRSKSIALEGMLYDFNKLSYIDLDASYWVPSATESLTVADRLFITTNMVSMNSLSQSNIYFFNKGIMDMLDIRYPYDCVYDNNWTYDVVIDMITQAQEDVNGDGVLNNKDRFGGIYGDSLLKGVCSAQLIEDNGNGIYTVIPYTEGMVDQYSKYSSFLESIKMLSLDQILEGHDISVFPSQFVAARFLSFGEDHCLFMQGSLDMTREFVDMQSDYGILPMPVVNAGDDYSCRSDHLAPMFSMPCQLEDPDMAAKVFDYLAYESERLLLPAYYETTIKTKSMQDIRDYAMLDIIRNSVRYDWVELYMWDSDLAQIRGKMLASGNFASISKRYGAKCQAELEEVVGKIIAAG